MNLQTHRPLDEDTVRIRISKTLAKSVAELMPELRVAEASAVLLRMIVDEKRTAGLSKPNNQ